MNPNYGYQLYQIQRVKTRAEVLADDARRGRCAGCRAGKPTNLSHDARMGNQDAERDQGPGPGHCPCR